MDQAGKCIAEVEEIAFQNMRPSKYWGPVWSLNYTSPNFGLLLISPLDVILEYTLSLFQLIIFQSSGRTETVTGSLTPDALRCVAVPYGTAQHCMAPQWV